MLYKQFFLILLGVLIIIAAAVVPGLQLLEAGSYNTNREAISSEIEFIAADAMEYYTDVSGSGSDEGSFDGYTIPGSMMLTAHGLYRAEGNGTMLEIEGESIVYGNLKIHVTLLYNGDGWSKDWDWK